MTQRARILVVDDEIGMQIALREVLQRMGHEVTVAGDAFVALERLEAAGPFDLILTDVRMPEMSGLELLERVRTRWQGTPVLVMTAHGTIEDAVGAMKQGAVDYLLKPFSTETVEEIVTRELARRATRPGETTLAESDDDDSSQAPSGDNSRQPIFASDSFRQILALAREVADSTATVLIQGESGTGKEVVARYIHQHSGRQNGTFVALNCAALPEGLLESELFGHEKGAFTGAILARKGKFELAHRGTLLLDEVSEMPLVLQAKLLRALQEREIDPIGSQRPVALDVRVIATTNRDLDRFVAEGNFREDLYYRLQVITLCLPPLRERRDDILPLAEFFVRRICRVNRRPRKRLGAAMRQFLFEQPWRGNVRELENFLERAVLLCKTDEISPDNIFLGRPLAPAMRPFASGPASPANTACAQTAVRTMREPAHFGAAAGAQPYSGAVAGTPAHSGAVAGSLPALAAGPIPPNYGRTDGLYPLGISAGEIVTLEEMERRLILKTLDEVGGNRTRAADLLGVSVRTIRNKLNLYGLGAESQAAAAAVETGA